MDNDELCKLILQSPLGKMVGEDVCREVVTVSTRRHYAAGTMIIQEGDPAEAIFLVCSGHVKVVRIYPDGRENVLAFIDPPHLFAEAAIFIGRYPATAIATEDSEVLSLHRAEVYRLVREHEAFLNFLFSTMAKWMQRLVAKIDQLTLSDATARVARYFIAELDKGPPQFDYRVPRIHLSAKKGDLATLLNVSQPSLSRILRKLQDDKIIDVQARTIYLNDLPALRKMMLPPLE